jgi:hypothetical protein
MPSGSQKTLLVAILYAQRNERSDDRELFTTAELGCHVF